MANYISEDRPFYVGRHSMAAPHLPVGSPERSALFAELRRTFCEDWKAAEESLQREREVAFGDLYFVAAGDAIKIGRTTDFTTRLRFIQAHNHEKAECLLLLKGQGWREKEFHKRFRTHRLRGEWFERCPEIEAEINRITAEEKSNGLPINTEAQLSSLPRHPQSSGEQLLVGGFERP